MNLGRSVWGEPEAPSADEIRARRVEAARRNTAWREIEETQLVKRERWFVDADSDALFTIYRGSVFSPEGGIAFDRDRPLVFYVSRAGDVVLLEKTTTPAATWSELLQRRAAPAQPPRRRVRAGRR